MKNYIQNFGNICHVTLPRHWTQHILYPALLLTLAVGGFGALTGHAQPVVVTQLYGFKGAPDGAAPVGNLFFGTDNMLYGTTSVGGSIDGGGAIFKLGRDGSGNLSSAELYDVGLGFSTSWQPQIATFTSPLSLGGSLGLSGSRFRGVSEG